VISPLIKCTLGSVLLLFEIYRPLMSCKKETKRHIIQNIYYLIDIKGKNRFFEGRIELIYKKLGLF
jgi:hypothetical protein